MTLTERIHANDCRVVGCERRRVPEALVCADHLPALWRNRLDRQPDGTFVPRRTFTARETTWSAA